MLFAATYPERTAGLVLINSLASTGALARVPVASLPRRAGAEHREDGAYVGRAGPARAASIANPDMTEDDRIGVRARPSSEREPRRPARLHADEPRRRRLRRPRLDPGADARSAPHGVARLDVRGARYLAEHIPGARLVELPGRNFAPSVGDADALLADRAVPRRHPSRGEWEPAEPDRMLATVLFTDIVGSTEKMAELGDRAWRELLESHHALVRRELSRFRGIEMDTAGDGFFARFDGPARAIRCAQAITRRCSRARHRASRRTPHGRVRARRRQGGRHRRLDRRPHRCAAEPGEVLVSSTVKDLVAGSGLDFEDRGTHELKGVPGEWRLYAVEPS